MSLIERNTPRNVTFELNQNPYAAGSVIANFGNTKVHITVTIEDKIPSWLKGRGEGWVTAEYSMLPSATHSRVRRERSKVGGRTMEIQRLIGRSLRSVVDLEKLGERSLMVDCDVLVADGGTRTASISGAYVALKLAIDTLLKSGELAESPLKEGLAAISVGINKNGKIIADLNYEEDSSCDTDMNIVMTDSGKFIEVQGTAEGQPFTSDQMQALLDCAKESLKVVFKAQSDALS
ncbi:MAG: ribonuclease PH [Bacteriovoracaceae bacterium]|jgi:ribonuclease PH|nr:ribonuclease PH [Bacteriovoracaceae bacterium]